MKSIDELITDLCPDGVEYCPLGKECDVLRGMRLTKGQLSNDYDFPVFHGGIVPIGYYDKSNRAPNTVMVINVGASAGTIGFSSVPFWSSDGCFCLKPADKVDSKFLYYVLKNNENRTKARMRVAGIPTLDVTAIKKLYIPIPHIKIQREIVRILDGFTGLIAELEAELAARQKQYEQYRDRVLESDIGTYKKVTVSDVCKNICSGGTPTAGNGKFYNGNIPWLRTQEVDWRDIVKTSLTITEEGLSNSSAKWIPANCVIVAMYGATAGKVAINRIPLTTNQACCNLEIDENVAEYKFVFYWLSYRYAQLKKLGQGTQSNINAAIVKKFPINLPSLQEQRRIVETLDKFDALCNDETSGLAAEIAARKKQYEYYRDRLLNFKRKGEVGSIESAQRGKRNAPRKGGGYYTEDGMKRLRQSGMKGHEAAERLIAEQIGERHRLLRPLTREAASILKSVKGMIPRALFLSNAIVREAERRAKEEKI